MGRRSARLSCVAGVAAIAVVSMAGCTAEGERVAETVTVTEPAEAPTAESSSIDKPPPPASWEQCDPNIEAKEGTTCRFAMNTFWAFWMNSNSAPVDVYSPSAAESLAVTCSGDSVVVCKASDGGASRFPSSALDGYSCDLADRYSASADLGPDPFEGLTSARSECNPGGDTTPPPDDQPPTEESAGCLEDYPDVCVPDDGFDYDCAEVDGTDFSVPGSDPMGFDRDGDGSGCESY